MAIIKSGPLVSLFKSVGGLNFYRADGTQYVRSKPVLPSGYVPTVNQLIARQLFGISSRQIDRVSLLAQMLGVNYSLVNKNATKTYRDVALGFMMRYLCRGSDGRPFSYTVKEELAKELEGDPGRFIAGMVPLSFQNAVPWPVGVRVSDTSSSVQVDITEEGWDYWYYQLLEIGYYPVKDAEPVLLWGSVDHYVPQVGPWTISKFNTSDYGLTATFLPGSIVGTGWEMTLYQWSLAYRLDAAYYDGLSGLYVCTAPVVVHLTTPSPE